MKTPFTDIELKYMQHQAGTKADGIIGSKTLRAMKLYTNTDESDPLKILVVMAQRCINEHALETNRPERLTKEDGFMGPLTDGLLDSLMLFVRGADMKAVKVETSTEGLFGTELILPPRPDWTVDLPEDQTIPMTKYFGKPGTNHKRLTFPYPMFYGDQRARTTMVNAKAYDHFEEMFVRILDVYGAQSIRELGLDQYSGCFNDRSRRGGSRLSTHAFAISMDLNAGNNRMRTPLNKALFGKKEYQSFWNAVYASGFKSLGLEYNKDAMHIQLTK